MKKALGEIDDLKSGLRRVALDLDELFDRFKRFQSRQAKRQAVDDAPPETTEGEPPTGDRQQWLAKLAASRGK